MESENTAGVEATETALPGIQHLGEMLQATEPGEPGEDDAGASDGKSSGSKEDKPKKFNDLAGKLGLELNDLYKLEIMQAEDGTAVTIENLKDFHAKQADYSMREIEFEERKTEQESAIMQAQEELRELMAALPEKAIKPEVLQKIRAKHEAQAKLERRRTLDVIPEWQDEKTRTADLEGMAEHLKQYGYPVNHLERVADHRQVKYIRDNWLREMRIRKALAAVKAGKPNPTTRQKPGNKAPSKQPLAGVKRGNARDKLEAVFSNID
jgi:hypothetical protein